MAVLSIKASEIDNWTSCDSRRAQELLPKLLWKLILASSEKIKDIHFPFEDAIQYSGYDGYLVTEDTSSFYPEGTSVWEFGTNENIKSKFNSDYEKRSQNSNGLDPKNTTFCFVTSRIWNHHEGIAEFTENKKRDSLWKDVRIFDANSIEMWLNQCPSVATWFSTIIGRPQNNIMSLSDYWDYIVNNTTPNMTADFFCYGRKKSIFDEITGIINSGVSQVIMTADSKIEGVLTLAADLFKDKNILKQQLSEKIIIALSSEGFYNACSSFKDVIIIPAFSSEIIPTPCENTLIYITENNGPIDLLYKNLTKIKIETRRRKDFINSLENLGINLSEANRITNDVKCRFLPFFRTITNRIEYKIPPWASYENLQFLIPALLANSWEGNLDGDREAIEILSGKKYDEYISSISLFTQGDNMPVFRLESSFSCISVNEIWDILAQHINDVFFENYKKCISFVFSETDPAFDLSEDKWNMASIYGKNSKFSERLKKGLILSMTKIIELDENEGLFKFNSGCTRECESLVLNIFDKTNDENRWRTLSAYIDDFVEATPDVILKIIENNVANDNEAFYSLFEASGDPLFTRNFYTHILWALEKLVWIKEYSFRAIKILVLLENKNIKYRISNCPMDSLLKVFCFWYPQGDLTVEEHNVILESIMKKHHIVGRKIINKLLPNETASTTMELSKFHWKYIEYPEIGITNEQYRSSVYSAASIFIESADSSYDDWETIIKHFSAFYKIICDNKIDIKQKGLELSEDDRLKLCGEIANYISRKRKYQDPKDGESEIINKMEELYTFLLPDSPLMYFNYFSHDFYGLNPSVCIMEEYDYHKEQAELKKLRISALEKTIHQFGIEAVLKLSQKVEAPQLLIDSLIYSKFFPEIDINYIIQTHKINPQFSEILISSIYYLKGIDCLKTILSAVAIEELEWLVAQLPLRQEIITFINSFPPKIQKAYWQNVNCYGINDEDLTFWKCCIKTLLNYERPYSALQALRFSDCSDSKLIIDILEAALKYHPKIELNGMNLDNISNDIIEHAFDCIHKYKQFDIVKVAQLELCYFNKFGLYYTPKCLVEYVLSNPSAFIELISCCFKQDNGEKVKRSETQKQLAKLTYRALEKIERLPGQNDSIINTCEFNSWIEAVLELAEKNEYTTACYIQLGRLLSYSPIDEDGIWPHKCVRDFLEKYDIEEINNHICMGVYNQRGFHTVTGGDEEERLSDIYRKYAQQLQLLYPKTARVVKMISDNYSMESKSERARELKGYY